MEPIQTVGIFRCRSWRILVDHRCHLRYVWGEWYTTTTMNNRIWVMDHIPCTTYLDHMREAVSSYIFWQSTVWETNRLVKRRCRLKPCLLDVVINVVMINILLFECTPSLYYAAKQYYESSQYPASWISLKTMWSLIRLSQFFISVETFVEGNQVESSQPSY